MRYRVTVFVEGTPNVDLVLRQNELDILRRELQAGDDAQGAPFWTTSLDDGRIVEMFRMSAVRGLRIRREE